MGKFLSIMRQKFTTFLAHHRAAYRYLLDAKMRSFEQKSKSMSKNEEIKKLRERIEALEFIKELQQDIIVELENWTGDEFSKKSLPESSYKEMQMGGIPQKKQSRTK